MYKTGKINSLKKHCIFVLTVKVLQIPVDLPDIVVNVNPNNPPYSVAIIQKLLQDVVALKFTSHVHSTVSTLPDNTIKLQNDLINFKQKENVPEVHIRLIWKNSKFQNI